MSKDVEDKNIKNNSHRYNEKIDKKEKVNKKEKNTISLILILCLSALIFYAIFSWSMDLRLKIILILAELIGTTYLLKMMFGFDTEMGLILYKTKLGIELIKDLSKFETFWTYFADLGLFLTYGLSAFKMFKMNHKWWKVLLGGIFLLSIVIVFVAPLSQYILVKSAHMGNMSNVKPKPMSLLQIVLLLSILFGGIFVAGILGLILKTFEIISNLYMHYTGHTAVHATPGATLILPGINLPLFEGALALLIVMIVHEGSHGVLAVLRKIKIKSTGIVLFGFLPLGAFVEPDEDQLLKSKSKYKSDVFVAGPTANLLCAILLLIIHIVLFFGLGQIYITNPILKFIRITIGLSIALNFIVGMINLLPVPLFDGYHLLEAGLGQPWTNYLMYITVAGIVIAFIPWFL